MYRKPTAEAAQNTIDVNVLKVLTCNNLKLILVEALPTSGGCVPEQKDISLINYKILARERSERSRFVNLADAM